MERVLRYAARGALALLAAFVLLLMTPAESTAHAVLVRSDPPAGSSLAVTPDTAHLWFSEDIAPSFTSARLVDGDGRTVPGASTATSALDPRAVDVALPDLQPGSYAVVWTVLAEDDGHTTSGVLGFTVGGAAADVVDTQALAATGATTSPAATALRWWRLLLLACVVGALAVALLVVSPATRRAPDAVVPTARAASLRLVILAAGAAALAVPATLAEAVPLAGATGGLGTVGRVLEDTRGGRLLVAQAAILLLLAVFALRLWAAGGAGHARPGPAATATAALLCSGVVVLEALRGHAASLDDDRIVALLLVSVHIGCALLWLGALVSLAVAVLPGPDRRGLARLIRQPFSRLAGGSVLALVATGLYTAGREVYDPVELLSTSYGRALVAKSVLVGLVAAVAVVNHRRLHGPTARVGARLVLAEAAVGVSALAGAAILSQSVPAPTPSTVVGASERPIMEANHGDLLMSVSATPDRPGTNAFTVLVASSRRPEPAPIGDVRLRFRGARQLTTVAVEPDRFVATGEIPGTGPRKATVTVTRAGRTYAFPVRWRLAPPPPVVTHTITHPLSDYTTTLALAVPCAAVLILSGGLVGGRLRDRRRLQEVPG